MSQQVLKNLESLGIDYLIAIGGDDTLSYAANSISSASRSSPSRRRWTTTSGTPSTASASRPRSPARRDAIQRQRTTVGSHERIGVFRVFGRDAGFTALYTAYVTSIRCVIPEYKVDLDKLIELLVRRSATIPSNYALVVLSEGAEWEGYKVQEYGEPDAYGHRKKASVAEVAQRRDQAARRRRDHRQRPDLRSALGRSGFRGQAGRVDLRHDGARRRARGQKRPDVRPRERLLHLVPIPDPKLGPRKVDIARMYNTERYRPNYANKRGLPIFLNRTKSGLVQAKFSRHRSAARPPCGRSPRFFNEAAHDEEHYPFLHRSSYLSRQARLLSTSAIFRTGASPTSAAARAVSGVF